ncbi:MAG: GAF domain-containing protein [Elusimicrobiales bacterium]|nr:GAF domain-containing protein [Elusimicrobiales bacterium]
MAEDIVIEGKNKEEKYKNLLNYTKTIINKNDYIISVLANLSSLIHYTFKFWWTGFYIVRENKLVLGPFQGPVACSFIEYGKGVCGTSWKEKRTIIVEDVNKFPGHIACSSVSKSEIVVPIFRKNREVFGVLDIDSEKYSNFDITDKIYLEKITSYISEIVD